MRFTQVYTPHDNGIAERRMRMIMEKVRAMLYDGHHPVALWGEAVRTAVHVINITTTEVLDGDSPYERWFRVKPAIGRLRVFGATAYRQIPDVLRKKTDGKAIK